MPTVIRIENLWKEYRLGVIGYGYWLKDLQSWWNRLRQPRRDQAFAIGINADVSINHQDRIWALKDLSLEVEEGEIFGIIGRNGAGKSTFLKIISRVTTPTRGHIKIRGRLASLLEVGIGFHPELTGRENVFLNGAILGMTIGGIKRKFDGIVDFAGVEKFIDTPVKRYSSGMYVRLAFAVAAFLDSDILIVDEVLAVGDGEFQKKCMARMGEVTQEGRTILFVSHNMGAIISLCKRAILLEEGRLTRQGTAIEVVDHYMTSASVFKRSKNGLTPLANHPGRLSSQVGPVRLKHCLLADESGNGATYLTVGKSGSITLGFEASQPLQGKDIVFVVLIDNTRGERICCLSSPTLTDLPNQGEVRCLIPRLPLVPGGYALTLACQVDAEWSDWVNQTVAFEVLGSDFYSTGKLPPEEHYSQMLMDYDWLAL